MSQTLLNLLPETKQVSASERLLKPRTLAIPLLKSDLARYYGHVHTGQLLVYYYLRSAHLVADPLSTLLQDLVPVAISQCIFCAVCLPNVGRWSGATDDDDESTRVTAAKAKKKPSSHGPRKTGSGHDDGGGPWLERLFPMILSLTLAFVIPPVPLMLLALILGAPLYPTALLPHTLALSVHVSLLATIPLFYTHGVSKTAWKDISAAWLPFDEAGVWGASVGTIVGAWFGAIPIALDWDREWQKWPCTVLWGAVIGWAVGRVLTSTVGLGIGNRINLGVEEYTRAAASDQTKKKD